MTKVIVRAPGKVNRRIAGVTFSEGRAEVDTDSAAYQFFKRRGYKIKTQPSDNGDASRPEEHVAPTGEHDASKRDSDEAEGDQSEGVESGGDESEDDESEDDESEDDESEGDESEGDESEGDESEGDESEEDESEEDGERPHPVQGSKAIWFEYLSGLKPDHGFDLEKVTRKELIQAVEDIEAK